MNLTQNELRDCALVACAVFISSLLALALSPVSPLALMFIGAALRLVTIKGHVTKGLVAGAILAGLVALVVAPIGSGLGLLIGFGAAHAAQSAQSAHAARRGRPRWEPTRPGAAPKALNGSGPATPVAPVAVNQVR